MKEAAMKHLHLVAAAAAALAVAACGGGGGNPAPPPVVNEVPASALVSSAALVEWGRALPQNDRAEPLDIRNATLPVSDSEEPRPI
jgi:hypothetical protein